MISCQSLPKEQSIPTFTTEEMGTTIKEKFISLLKQ